MSSVPLEQRGSAVTPSLSFAVICHEAQGEIHGDRVHDQGAAFLRHDGPCPFQAMGAPWRGVLSCSCWAALSRPWEHCIDARSRLKHLPSPRSLFPCYLGSEPAALQWLCFSVSLWD